MSELFESQGRIKRTADVSECGLYRWSLHRSWSLWNEAGEHIKGKGIVCFVMLNPSTADGTHDDPTIRRCIGFAKRWGYNALSVRNLFPWRATDPKELKTAISVTGGRRGDNELLAAMTADLVVAAWGANVPYSRDVEAIHLFKGSFPTKPIVCLGLTKNRSPKHPLYVKAETDPVLFMGG